MPSSGVYLSDEIYDRVKERANDEYRGKVSAWIADAVELKLSGASAAPDALKDNPLTAMARHYLPARAETIATALKGVNESIIMTRILDSLADHIEGRSGGEVKNLLQLLKSRRLTVHFEAEEPQHLSAAEEPGNYDQKRDSISPPPKREPVRVKKKA